MKILLPMRVGDIAEGGRMADGGDGGGGGGFEISCRGDKLGRLHKQPVFLQARGDVVVKLRAGKPLNGSYSHKHSTSVRLQVYTG